jgi:hypothetical protein
MNDRQRLEAIIGVVCKYLPPDGIPANEAMSQIIALVDPLPEPVQEPVFCEYCGGNDDADFGLPTDHCTDCDRPDPAQPADHSEQDLDMVDHGDELTIAYLDGVHTGKQIAKREWVDLTNDEQDEIAAYHGLDCMVYKPAFHAIKAKLKEKNT